MSSVYEFQLVQILVLVAISLVWAKYSKLDLGFNKPRFSRNIAAMILIYFTILIVEWVAFPLINQSEYEKSIILNADITVKEYFIIYVIFGPIQEEILFRGLLFDIFFRKNRILSALIIPSVMWSLLHVQYGIEYILSITLSGIVLAMIRKESGSIFIGVILHIFGNICIIIF